MKLPSYRCLSLVLKTTHVVNNKCLTLKLISMLLFTQGFWINFSVTLFQVFNLKNFLVLSIWNWVKLNWILKFFFFFINTSLQCLCMLIRVVVQFYLSKKQWNWIIPPSVFHLWMIISFFIKILRYFISVVISRIFKNFDNGIPHNFL